MQLTLPVIQTFIVPCKTVTVQVTMSKRNDELMNAKHKWLAHMK